MALAVAQVGAHKQSGAGGTNSTATVVSDSATWNTGDLIVAPWGMVYNAVSAWNLASVSASGGALGTVTIYSSSQYEDGSFSYHTKSAIALIPIATGFTGTLTLNRTAGNADHWEAACFLRVTGNNANTALQNAQNGVSGSGVSGTATVTFGSTPASPSLLVASIASNDLPANVTPPSGWTESELDENSWGAGHAGQWKLGSGSQANVFTAAGTHSGLSAIAVEIEQAAGGAIISRPIFFPRNRGLRIR